MTELPLWPADGDQLQDPAGWYLDWQMCLWGTWHHVTELDLDDVCFCGEDD